MVKKAYNLRVNDYFHEYCENTSIHGLKYVGERKRSVIERLWWTVAITICMLLCFYMVFLTYKKWESSPVVVTFATKEMPIYEIPFPAITICPEPMTPINMTEVMLNITRGNIKNDSDIEDKIKEYSSLICDIAQTNWTKSYHEYLSDANDFVETMYSAQRFQVILLCLMDEKTVDCSNMFTTTVTDAGVCFSYNILDKTEMFADEVIRFENEQDVWKTSDGWNLEDGYIAQDKNFRDQYPRRADFVGLDSGMFILIMAFKRQVDFSCSPNKHQGFKVALHLPQGYPVLALDHFRLPFQTQMAVAIKPEMGTVSEDVKKYSVEKRGCYMVNDRPLRYFKMYTQRNCQLECLTNITLHVCGCVNFYMPRTNTTLVCAVQKKQCIRRAAYILQSYKYQTFENITDYDAEEAKRLLDRCRCLPLCADLSYITDITSSPINWLETMELNGISTDSITPDQMHISTMNLYFKYSQFTPSERSELYSLYSLIANFGGLIGVFTGFSMLSIVELVYYCTLRLLCDIRKFNKKQEEKHVHAKELSPA